MKLNANFLHFTSKNQFDDRLKYFTANNFINWEFFKSFIFPVPLALTNKSNNNNKDEKYKNNLKSPAGRDTSLLHFTIRYHSNRRVTIATL